MNRTGMRPQINTVPGILRVAVAALTLVGAGLLHAGPSTYQCKITHTYRSDKTTGLFEPAQAVDLPYEFTVDRQTGRLTGGGLFDDGKATSRTVFHQGDRDFPFRRIADYGNGTVDFLQVNEIEDGPVKTFVATSMWFVASGLCR